MVFTDLDKLFSPENEQAVSLDQNATVISNTVTETDKNVIDEETK